MIATGAALGLGLGWLGALALSRLFAGRTGVVLPVAIGRPELLMLAALVLAGLILAVIPALSAYRQSVSATLRG